MAGFTLLPRLRCAASRADSSELHRRGLLLPRIPPTSVLSAAEVRAFAFPL